MAAFNGMFPVLPGKEDAARAWIDLSQTEDGPPPEMLIDWRA